MLIESPDILIAVKGGGGGREACKSEHEFFYHKIMAQQADNVRIKSNVLQAKVIITIIAKSKLTVVYLKSK